MKTFSSLTKIAVLGVSVFGLCQLHVRALPLPAGGGLYPVPIEPDPVGGTLLASTGPVPFAAATFSGTLTSQVFNNDLSNPFGLSALTFTYQLTCLTGPDGISELSLANFTGFLTDASYQSPAGFTASGLPPTSVGRQIDGSVVDFTFQVSPIGPGTLLPGETSALLVIQASASVFAPGIASVIDGSTASPILTLEPSIVPEPGTIGLVVAGLGILGLALRRKN